MSPASTCAPKLFSKEVIDGVLIRDVLVDTSTPFTMVGFARHDRLPSRPASNSFTNSASNIVAVCGASAEVSIYIDVPLQIAKIEIAHSLPVVTYLLFSWLIEMVLQPHAEKMSFGSSAPLELSVHVCDICLEQRTNPNPSYCSALAVLCVAEFTIVASTSASLVTGSLPRTVHEALTIVIQPLNYRDSRLCRSACSLRSDIAMFGASLWLTIPISRSRFLLVLLSLLWTLFVPSRNCLKPLTLPFACATSRNFESALLAKD